MKKSMILFFRKQGALGAPSVLDKPQNTGQSCHTVSVLTPEHLAVRSGNRCGFRVCRKHLRRQQRPVLGEVLMEQIAKLKDRIQPVLESCGVILYEAKWLPDSRTLQIAIMKEDGSMDLDTCAEVSDQLSGVLDEDDPIEGAYTLEVCSPGAEREIRDLQELEQMDHPYVFLRLKHPVKKMTELTGEVQQYSNGMITLMYRDKAAVRTAEIPAEDVEYIRLAVRI